MGELVVVGPIGRGGMGTVELAFRFEGGFRRTLALKRLNDSISRDSSARRSLVREAKLSGQVRHPNVVSVLDVGSDRRGMYLVMDYVAGVNLKELLNASKAPLPPQIAIAIASSLARGLSAAHTLEVDGSAVQIVHRDVTPANVLISFDGVARLTDFGLARGIEDPKTRELLKGTSGYMSPEQLRFEPLDPRSDLFSLGVILFEMLTGTRLYEEEDPSMAARRILTEPAPDLGAMHPGLPRSVVQLTASLLSKTPTERPPSALACLRQLEVARRELVCSEGVKELCDYVAIELGSLRSEHHQWMGENEKRLAQRRSVAPESPARTRSRILWVAALLLLVIAPAAVFVWQRQPETGEISAGTEIVESETVPPRQHEVVPEPVPAPENASEPAVVDAGAAEEAPSRARVRREPRPNAAAARAARDRAMARAAMPALVDWMNQ